MSSDAAYQDCFHDIIYELVEKTKDSSIYELGEFNTGYRMALYAVLSLISNQVSSFNLNPASAGLHTFDPDRWLREGKDYWRGQ